VRPALSRRRLRRRCTDVIADTVHDRCGEYTGIVDDFVVRAW
jgi:hypothetical protein